MVLREAGRLAVASWAATYRSLARQLKGDPARMLEVFATEVHPWLLGEGGGIVDAGPAGALVALGDALPEEFQAGLLEGAVEAAGVRGATVASQGAHFAVAWEADEAARSRPGPLALLARAVRAPLLPATIVPVLVGAALAWREGHLDAPYLGLTLLGVALFQLGANAANDYFDRGADQANLTPTPFSGGSRVIQRGLLRARTVALLALALFAAGTAVGLHIAFHLQWDHGAGLVPIVGLGVLGLGLGLLYSAPPFRLAHRGLGEVAVGLGFGPLLVAGSYLVQTTATIGIARVSPEALLFSVPVGLLIAAVLTINEFPRHPWDAQAGKRTLVVRLGAARAIRGYGALLALAYGSIAAAALLTGWWPVLLALLTLPLAVRAWRILRRAHGEPYKLMPANATTLALHLGTGLLLLGGLVLARVLPGA
jgi:1,4-dihydroxy-2-naphthoate octaprenyltransferase